MRTLLLRLLRVPHNPEPPPGSPPKVFRAAPNYFTLRAIRWTVGHFFALIGLLWALWFIHMLERKDIALQPFIYWWKVGEVIAWSIFIIELACGWILLRLDFELRWYMLSDRALRIREGITTVREKTIALANIQNISVKQGPLQRLLGIADVEVKTAGGGGGMQDARKQHVRTESMHVAYFRGVDNAQFIRDLVREGVRLQRNAGLGDPDEATHPHQAQTDDVHAAAADLLAAARELRAAI